MSSQIFAGVIRDIVEGEEDCGQLKLSYELITSSNLKSLWHSVYFSFNLPVIMVRSLTYLSVFYM